MAGVAVHPYHQIKLLKLQVYFKSLVPKPDFFYAYSMLSIELLDQPSCQMKGGRINQYIF